MSVSNSRRCLVEFLKDLSNAGGDFVGKRNNEIWKTVYENVIINLLLYVHHQLPYQKKYKPFKVFCFRHTENSSYKNDLRKVLKVPL